jgi:hypothetical protein
MCAAQAVSTCGLNGFCDGNGGCQKFATGTTCASATCNGSFVVGASTCSTSGVCTAPAPNPQCSPFQCSGGACKTTCTGNGDCVSPNVCTGGICAPPINITVQLKEINIGTTQWITPNFRIINNGTSAITLSQLTVRYWYTLDGGSSTQNSNCDYSLLPMSCGAVSFGASSFVAVSPARTNADSYFQFGFTAAAGTLAPGVTMDDVQLRWSTSNFVNFDQTNDYSYNAATAYTPTTKVTVYLNGALVYGTEPM